MIKSPTKVKHSLRNRRRASIRRRLSGHEHASASRRVSLK